jgi:hypothetical protein
MILAGVGMGVMTIRLMHSNILIFKDLAYLKLDENFSDGLDSARWNLTDERGDALRHGPARGSRDQSSPCPRSSWRRRRCGRSAAFSSSPRAHPGARRTSGMRFEGQRARGRRRAPAHALYEPVDALAEERRSMRFQALASGGGLSDMSCGHGPSASSFNDIHSPTRISLLPRQTTPTPLSLVPACRSTYNTPGFDVLNRQCRALRAQFDGKTAAHLERDGASASTGRRCMRSHTSTPRSARVKLATLPLPEHALGAGAFGRASQAHISDCQSGDTR